MDKVKLFWAVLLMGGIAWGQKPACTKDNIGQPYIDNIEKVYPYWVCTADGWMNVHPAHNPTPQPDDIHIVTEKEWQELQAEVKLLHKAIHLMESGGRP